MLAIETGGYGIIAEALFLLGPVRQDGNYGSISGKNSTIFQKFLILSGINRFPIPICIPSK